MSGPTMSVGTSAQDAVGTNAQAVGDPTSDFFKAVMGTVFLNSLVNLVQDMSMDRPMMPGMGLADALGPRAEVYGMFGSPLEMTALATMAEQGVKALIYGKDGSAPSLGGDTPQTAVAGTQNTVQQPTQDTQPVTRMPVNKGPGM